ncbi:MAG: diguanylate cyclase, partial [Spirochaetota bacterium]
AWEEISKAGSPVLLLVDWMMPVMDGLELTRRIRACNSTLMSYVIIITSKLESGDMVEGLDAGANDFITKPLDPTVLRARIDVGLRMLELQGKLLKARDALEYEANHDHLTGIPNRRSILGLLSGELSRSGTDGRRIAVGILDLDRFKEINDTHGHRVGDEAIIGFVGNIKAALRDVDSLGRLGGDEFLVVAPVVDAGEAHALFETLRAAIADHAIPSSCGEIRVSASIGFAISNGSASIDELIAKADVAMYRAKNEGRNRVRHDGARK